MRTIGLRVLVLSIFVTVLFDAVLPIAEAQVDEAYKVYYYSNLKKFVPMLVDLAQAEKFREYKERRQNFNDDLDRLQRIIKNAGSGLHDKERKWLSETTRDKVVHSCDKVRVAAGSIEIVLGEAKSPSSEISNFKSEWQELSDAMEKLWDDYQKRAKALQEYSKEIEERVKAFQNECRGCF